jgi:hypothetical protein
MGCWFLRRRSLLWVGFGDGWTSSHAPYSGEVDLMSFIPRKTIRGIFFSSFFRCELIRTLWISPVKIHGLLSGLFSHLPFLSYSNHYDLLVQRK